MISFMIVCSKEVLEVIDYPRTRISHRKDAQRHVLSE
jgi:hypothetical protein